MAQGEFGTGVFRQSVIAFYYMLQQPGRGLVLNLGNNHIVKDGGHRKEPLGRLAQVIEAWVVQENFLDYEGRHRLTQLRASLHDSEAKWNYLSLQQKADDLGVIDFDECSNYT